MPTYDYYCENCNLHFEKFQSISAHEKTRCSQCDGEVKHIYGETAGFLFKGGSPTKNTSSQKEPCCGQGNQCDNPKQCCEH
jgi:putative FmdB family regulatory protein